MKIETINGNRTRMLENEFYLHKQGRSFKLLKDCGEYKVFAVGLDGAKPSMKVLEVVKTRLHKKHHLDTSTEYEYIELYPSNSDWGKRGLSYTTMDGVNKQLKRLGIVDNI